MLSQTFLHWHVIRHPYLSSFVRYRCFRTFPEEPPSPLVFSSSPFRLFLTLRSRSQLVDILHPLQCEYRCVSDRRELASRPITRYSSPTRKGPLRTLRHHIAQACASHVSARAPSAPTTRNRLLGFVKYFFLEHHTRTHPRLPRPQPFVAVELNKYRQGPLCPFVSLHCPDTKDLVPWHYKYTQARSRTNTTTKTFGDCSSEESCRRTGTRRSTKIHTHAHDPGRTRRVPLEET